MKSSLRTTFSECHIRNPVMCFVRTSAEVSPQREIPEDQPYSSQDYGKHRKKVGRLTFREGLLLWATLASLGHNSHLFACIYPGWCPDWDSSDYCTCLLVWIISWWQTNLELWFEFSQMFKRTGTFRLQINYIEFLENIKLHVRCKNCALCQLLFTSIF